MVTALDVDKVEEAIDVVVGIVDDTEVLEVLGAIEELEVVDGATEELEVVDGATEEETVDETTEEEETEEVEGATEEEVEGATDEDEVGSSELETITVFSGTVARMVDSPSLIIMVWRIVE